jgi:molybdate transport system ATP-binding protein
MLSFRVVKRLGAFELDAALDVADRSVTVLVGESGSGKTTLLRLIAGLARPDRGRIEVDGTAWFDDATERGLAAWERSVGYVSQDYALFPHLSAGENVAFGLRALGLPAREVVRRTVAALERLGVAEFAARRPRALSGGQQQRIAIARAIVLEPRVLLLDEPLSALDARTRRSVRGELRRLLADLPCTTLYVTHSPAEALAFGAQIAVLEAGRVSQQGSRDALMRHPLTRYVAEFLGVNFFRGTIATGPAGPGTRIAVPHGDLIVSDAGDEGDTTVVVRPREITLSRERPGGTARNVFEGVIEDLVPEPPAGDQVRVSLGTSPPLIAEVTRQAVEALQLAPGVRVFASFKASGVAVAGPADDDFSPPGHRPETWT